MQVSSVLSVEHSNYVHAELYGPMLQVLSLIVPIRSSACRPIHYDLVQHNYLLVIILNCVFYNFSKLTLNGAVY